MHTQTLKPVGIVCDVEFNGVDGGKMDMAWAEITLKPSPRLRRLQESAVHAFRCSSAMSPRKRKRSESIVSDIREA